MHNAYSQTSLHFKPVVTNTSNKTPEILTEGDMGTDESLYSPESDHKQAIKIYDRTSFLRSIDLRLQPPRDQGACRNDFLLSEWRLAPSAAERFTAPTNDCLLPVLPNNDPPAPSADALRR